MMLLFVGAFMSQMIRWHRQSHRCGAMLSESASRTKIALSCVALWCVPLASAHKYFSRLRSTRFEERFLWAGGLAKSNLFPRADFLLNGNQYGPYRKGDEARVYFAGPT